MKHVLNIDAPAWVPGSARTSPAPDACESKSKKPAQYRQDDPTKANIVGVYFGAFDPPHEGHFRLARSAIDALGLSTVFMIPNVDAPFKKTSPLANRLGMLSAHPLAKQGLVQALASPDGVTNWPGRMRMCELAGEIARERGIPGASVVMIVGQDSFESSIRRTERRVLEAVHVPVYVFPRLGCEPPVIPEWLGGFSVVTSYRDAREISSTRLRAAFARGSDVEPSDLDSDVAAYAKAHELYTHAPVIVLLGGPGTGKSTLGKALCRARKLTHLNPGDLYRAALADERFQTTVQQLVDTDRATWAERLRVFLERAEQQAMKISRNSAFVTERKRPSEVRASCERIRQHCTLVVYLRASTACMLERVRTRGRGGTDDASRVHKFVEREAARCEEELAQLAESGMPVLNVDTTDKSEDAIREEVESALRSVESEGPVGSAADMMQVDAETVIRQTWEALPPALLQHWQLCPATTEADRGLVCRDCKQVFTFSCRDQKFYKEKGWVDPMRCPSCRARKGKPAAAGTGARSYHGPT